jgi:hypothetical protein
VGWNRESGDGGPGAAVAGGRESAVAGGRSSASGAACERWGERSWGCRGSPGTVRHSSIAARVGAQLEREGRRILSEREIFARERVEGKRIFSAECRSGRYHRPDLVLLGETAEAIELEPLAAFGGSPVLPVPGSVFAPCGAGQAP